MLIIGSTHIFSTLQGIPNLTLLVGSPVNEEKKNLNKEDKHQEAAQLRFANIAEGCADSCFGFLSCKNRPICGDQ